MTQDNLKKKIENVEKLRKNHKILNSFKFILCKKLTKQTITSAALMIH